VIDGVPELCWSGSYAYRAKRLHRPESLEQVQEVVAAARHLRVLGTRHSFTGIADSDELITLSGLPQDVEIDLATSTASVPAGMTYAELAEELHRSGLALHNLASLPHVAVGGAVATATHGSGDRLGNLATAVAALEVVTSGGEVLRVRRGDPGFDGMVVGLGALGAVTRVTLDVEPAYEVSQRVFEGLSWRALEDHLEAVTSAGDSVSLFTSWGPEVEQVWVKSRAQLEDPRSDLFGAAPATAARHPIPGLDPGDCTTQLGRPGPWSDRLPHFRAGFRASRGEEIQSEHHVPRVHALAAIEAVRGVAAVVQPLLLVSEIRTVAADALWMSPQQGRDTVSFHFTWKLEPRGVHRAVATVESVLAALEARPHWGKLFTADASEVRPLYGHLPEFLELVHRLDPSGVFRNDWFDMHLGAGDV